MLGSCLVNSHLRSRSFNFPTSLLTRVKELQVIAQAIPGRCGNWLFLQPSRVAPWFTNFTAHPRYAAEVTKTEEWGSRHSSSRIQAYKRFNLRLTKRWMIISVSPASAASLLSLLPAVLSMRFPVTCAEAGLDRDDRFMTDDKHTEWLKQSEGTFAQWISGSSWFSSFCPPGRRNTIVVSIRNLLL